MAMFAGFVGWGLVASALVFFTWNRVIAHVSKAKPVKYWQALLFLATVCFLGAPRAYNRHMMMHHCATGTCSHGANAQGGERGSDCQKCHEKSEGKTSTK